MVRPVNLHPLTQQPPVSLGGLPWAAVPIEGTRPPLAMGPWCWEGHAARAHHPLRPDPRLTAGLGAASGSPSFPSGEAEGK